MIFITYQTSLRDLGVAIPTKVHIKGSWCTYRGRHWGDWGVGMPIKIDTDWSGELTYPEVDTDGTGELTYPDVDTEGR